MGRRVDLVRANELKALASVLVYGASRSRRRLATTLLRADEQAGIRLLAGTVRSGDSWQLRARSLEVLGLVAGSADRATAERVLLALLGTDRLDGAIADDDSGRGDSPK